MHSLTFAAIKPGETAVVFGAGPIGLLTIAALKLGGAGRVWAVEPLAHRRDMAVMIGADVVLDAEDPVTAILHDTAKRGVDVAFEHVGPDTFNGSLLCLKRGGRLVTCGSTTGQSIQMNLLFCDSKPMMLPDDKKRELAIALADLLLNAATEPAGPDSREDA